MAFAGIFQPFARLRWIRFGALMRDRKFSRHLSVPQTTALALALRPRLRVRFARSEITIHEFGRHRHHDQSKNPSHHTKASKLAPLRAVLKRSYELHFNVAALEFQPFPCRPCGNGSGEKLQALLSQREVMLQLPLHLRPQILRWTCACKVP